MSNEENPCEYHIKVMKPDCVVPCTFRENDKLIDLRPTLRSTTNTIHVRFENEYFGLSLCGAPTICRNRTIGACKVNNSQIIPLLHVETKHLVYNADENQLAIKGYYRYGTQKHGKCVNLVFCLLIILYITLDYKLSSEIIIIGDSTIKAHVELGVCVRL